MSYSTQSDISGDSKMRARVAQAAAEQGCADAGLDPDQWSQMWRRIWAAAPGWDLAWESAVAGENPSPGDDPAVITDAMVLAQVQSMMPFTKV